MLVNYSYKIRLYPNREQEKMMLAIIDGTRWVYNHYLEERKKHYLENKKTLPYLVMARDLTQLRRTNELLHPLQAEPLQQALRRLDSAYNSFFRKQNSFPKFKSGLDSRQSFQKHQDWRVQGKKIQIQKDLVVKFRGNIEGEDFGTLVVSWVSGRWFASISAKKDVKATKRFTKPIGIDVGSETLATLSTGEKFSNFRAQEKLQSKLTKAQRQLTKKKKGSYRRKKAKLKVARIYQKIADTRANHIHNTTHAIVNKNPSLIAIEDLNVKKMMGKRSVARSLGDASLGEFLRQITYKQEWRGGKVVKIDRYFPSSKTCSKCGFILDSLPLSKRSWKCPQCDTKHDRDVNAAKNILKQAS